jgi:uncharacterized ferritin-like protein (DUF455 family)
VAPQSPDPRKGRPAEALGRDRGRTRTAPTASVRAFCRRILASGDLASKLAPPRQPDGTPLDDARPGPALEIARPLRDPGLALRSGVGRLPSPRDLSAPSARARCLATFAHHELMATELFAWALLRWPELPRGLRRGFLRVLAEEQRHCRLYLARLRALGSDLHEHRLSDYFWKHAPAIADSPHGPRAFLAAMGLTLEQANLDFSLVYRDGFRAAGDEASARVCQAVHDDEIGHVRLAARWLRRLAPGARDDVQRYAEAVPFPLGAARAKARRFDADSRRRAGLSDPFIEHVRRARSSQELRSTPHAPRPR